MQRIPPWVQWSHLISATGCRCPPWEQHGIVLPQCAWVVLCLSWGALMASKHWSRWSTSTARNLTKCNNGSPVQALSFPRGKHAAVAFQKHIFLLGGMDGGYRCLASAESLSVSTEGSKLGSLVTWAKLPHLRFARSECAASAVQGAVIVIGGVANGWTTLSNAERYEPSIGQWEVLLDMSIIRRDCASAAVAGELYVMGGMSFGGRSTSKVERLSLAKWQDVVPLPGPRCGCCAASVQL